MKRLATALVATVIVVFSLSAQGVTLLSNLDNPTAAGGFGGSPDAADHFQTGGQGLEVTAVNVKWDTASSSPGVNQVLIYTDAGGLPSTTTVGTPFTNPDVTTAGVMQYAGTALLAPNTVYWMVVDISDSSRMAYSLEDGFVADPSTAGAQILAHSAFGDNEAGTWQEDQATLQYAIVGVGTDYQYAIGLDMTASFYDPNFEGSGINTEILSLPTAAKDGEKGEPGLVVVYLYSFDTSGLPIFAFGVGTFVEDTMTVEMLMDYDGSGPFWGPGWDPDDFEGQPFVDIVIVWADCGHGVADITMDPSFLAANPGWASYSMNLIRITNPLGQPQCL